MERRRTADSGQKRGPGRSKVIATAVLAATIVTRTGGDAGLKKAAPVAGLCLRLERGRPEGGAAQAITFQFALIADIHWTKGQVREGPIVLQKSFCITNHKLSEL
jgi:hypothetical protein